MTDWTREQVVFDDTAAAAREDALTWQAEARNRNDQPSQDDVDRGRLDQLAERCPAAQVAGALLGISGLPPVATDPDSPTTATSATLTTLAAVCDHYRHRNADGAGLQLGAGPGRPTLVAVRGVPSAWANFMAAHALVTRRNFDGRIAEDRTYRDSGRPVSVSWQPPAASTRSSGVLFGGAEITAAARRPVRPGQNEPGWLVWAVAPAAGGRTVSFRGRKLGDGLEVLAAGVVPFHARRGDGWVLNADVPMAEPLPAWLVNEFGGRWTRRAAA